MAIWPAARPGVQVLEMGHPWWRSSLADVLRQAGAPEIYRGQRHLMI